MCKLFWFSISGGDLPTDCGWIQCTHYVLCIHNHKKLQPICHQIVEDAQKCFYDMSWSAGHSRYLAIGRCFGINLVKVSGSLVNLSWCLSLVSFYLVLFKRVPVCAQGDESQHLDSRASLWNLRLRAPPRFSESKAPRVAQEHVEHVPADATAYATFGIISKESLNQWPIGSMYGIFAYIWP